MRVMLVCQDLRHGRSGQDVATWRLARALCARPDVRLTVVTGKVHPGAALPCRTIVLPCLPVWHGSVQFLTFRAAWTLARGRLTRDQDLVVGSSPLWPGVDVACVHFLSLAWLEAPSGHRGLRWLHDRWRHVIAARAERRLRRRTGPLLLPVSQGLARSLERHLGRSGPVLPNATDPERFRPGSEPVLRAAVLRAAGWPEDARILLFVGGAWHRKGVDVALDALERLPQPWVLLVVGPGPQAVLRRRGERVHGVGLQADTAPWYRLAEALLLPSRYDTDALVVWEALGSGVPVIAAPFPGHEAWAAAALIATTAEDIAAAVATLDARREVLLERARALLAARHPDHIAERLLTLAREARS